MAYGHILPKEILELPNNGCINIHLSILPRWRGAAPIEHCLMNGDKETGISPGQACVFYKKDQYGHKVLGGGWIKE